MKKNHSLFSRIGGYISSHKIISAIAIIIIGGGAYYWYHSANKVSADTQYTIAQARMGSIRQTVTGSGQVSASNQLDVTSKVSGAITSIKVSVGDHVKQGDLIATVDSTDAISSLESARISLAKITEAPKETDVSSASTTIAKSYNDALNSAASAYSDMPSIISSLKDMFYSRDGYLASQQATFLTSTGRDYRDAAGESFDKASGLYESALLVYKSINRNSSTSDIDNMLEKTYVAVKALADALKNTQTAVNYISNSQPDYQKSVATSAVSNATTWASEINSDLASIVSSKSTIQSSINSYNTLTEGPDSLDLKSAQLSLQNQERNYANYFIRAPFDGIIGRIPVKVYDQAGSATIATIIGDQKMASISLNEVDAAKISKGQPAEITFDAIDGFTASGTVSEVDLVGTVTQGVVTYNAKILINDSDARIKPGMSVNVTIITNQQSDVLVVPASAIKTQGGTHYVQIFDTLPTSANSTQSSTTRNRTASSTAFAERFRNATTSGNFNFASSTKNFATSTFNFGNGGSFANRTVTLSSPTPPRNVTVTIGDSDDTNTVITGGLSAGQYVVSRTTASGTAQTTTTQTPTLLNSLRGGGGNASFRAGAAR